MSLQSISTDAQTNILDKTLPESITKTAVGEPFQELVEILLQFGGSGCYIKDDKIILGLDVSQLPNTPGILTVPTTFLLGDVSTLTYSAIQIINGNAGIQVRTGTELANPTGISIDINGDATNGHQIDVRTNNNQDRTDAKTVPGGFVYNLTKDGGTLSASLGVDTGGFVWGNSQGLPIRYQGTMNILNDDDVPDKKYVDSIVTTTVNVVTQSTTLAMQNSICYTYDGTGDAVFTLPPIVGNEGKRIGVINDSANTVTVDSDAGANDIMDSGVKSNTSTIVAGGARILLNNSKNWVYLT